MRAKPQATVSGPLRWTELRQSLSLQQLTVRTVPRRVARVGDLWGEALGEGNTARQIKDALH